tara:strand:+ start:246 stop:500 length:255 start_codon:yes stop_codon:yes gene_type:complete
MKQQIRKLTKQMMNTCSKNCSCHQGTYASSALRSAINQIKNNRECAFCPHPNFKFRDELSRKEYAISGLCMDCQDEMFGKGGKQ